MRLVKYALGFILLLIVALVFFAPKKELYFLLEKQIAKEGVVISGEQISQNPVGLKLQNPHIYYRGINSAKAKQITATVLLLFNRVEVRELQVDDSLYSMFPVAVQVARLDYLLWQPLKIKVLLKGNFGTAAGYYDILKRDLKIRLIKAEDISAIKRHLKKDDRGWFYELKL